MEALGDISLKATKKMTISSVCTIFAQQEVITHLSDGVSLPDVVAGFHYAIASRTTRMVRRLRVEPDVVFTGGVAKNIGVVNALRESIGFDIFVPQEPLFTGALGAALLGRERTMKALTGGEILETKGRKLEEATFFE
jgi:activator of 2-hydroxyglutaryl-CoA dehydratase